MKGLGNIGVWLLLAVATCAEPSPRARPPAATAPATTPSTTAPATAVSAPPAVVVPQADGVPSVVSVAPSAEAAPVARTTPRRTDGKIWCETELCDLATQVCCVVKAYDGSESRNFCAQRLPPGTRGHPCCPQDVFCGNDGLTLERSCDEASDCPEGQRCCELSGGEGADMWREWCSDACWDEVCLAGGKCSNGNRCESDEEDGGGAVGRCPLQIYPPRCGGAKCKQGELCCWSSEKRRARCAAACDADDDVHFECTSPGQCRPFDCNTLQTVPRKFFCGGGGWVTATLCETLKDCPPRNPTLGLGFVPTACSQRPDMPPGVKACEYEYVE